MLFYMLWVNFMCKCKSRNCLLIKKKKNEKTKILLLYIKIG